MGTKFIDNRIETTDYDIAACLKYMGYDIDFKELHPVSKESKTKIKMCITLKSKDDVDDFWVRWHKGKIKLDPNKYSSDIRHIRSSVLTLLKAIKI